MKIKTCFIIHLCAILILNIGNFKVKAFGEEVVQQQNYTGSYRLESGDVTITLTLKQDQNLNITGTLYSSNGSSFALEGMVSEGIASGVCKGNEGGLYFEAYLDGNDLTISLIEPDEYNMPDYNSSEYLVLSRTSQQPAAIQGGASPVEKLAALEALQQQKELEDKQNYEQALNLTTDKYTKQINELSEKVGLFEQKERSMLIGSSLSEALTEARVNPLHSEYVTSYFKQQAQLVDGKVVIGDKPLSDAIKEWSETDQGKAVRLAPDNARGDSLGTKNVSGSGNTMTPDEKRAHDINTRMGI